MQKQSSLVVVSILFLTALLATLLFASLWAKVFFGSWLAVSFQNELPNILIASSALTALIVVWQSRASGRTRLLLIAGLVLIALEVLLELPLKKYVALMPMTPIRSWFFLFGMTEFTGVMLTLVGVTALLRELKSKP